jgi:hypothetical protein
LTNHDHYFDRESADRRERHRQRRHELALQRAKELYDLLDTELGVPPA